MTGIALVGFMGCGKSTIGQALAQRMGWRFLDLDTVIEEQAGCSVSDIFAKEGESGFRERETATLNSLGDSRRLVLACGGGIVLLEANRRFLKEYFHVVYLDVTVAEIKRRLAGNYAVRPLLFSDDPEARIAQLYQARRELYLDVAESIIPVSGESVEDTVKLVLRATREACAQS